MAAIVKVWSTERAVYIDFDDGSQVEYVGTLDDLRDALQRDADRSAALAPQVALLNDMAINGDPTQKCDIIGKDIATAIALDGETLAVDVAAISVKQIDTQPVEVKRG